AIRHPLYLAEALDAELSVLLRGRPAPNSRLVAFACRSAILALRKADRGSSPWRDGILPMEVPCLGALGWFLPLRAFDLGAEVVALLGCSAACQYGFDPAAVEAPLAATRRLLDAWAVGSERLVAINGDSPTTQASALASLADQIAALPPQPLATGEPVAADEHRYELAPLIRAMHRRLAGDPALCLGFEGMPLGLVTVDSERCSACGLCARHCPTQALTVDEKDEAFSLTHRAELCTACGLCAEVCPEEGAIQVEQRLDIARLTASPEIVKTDRLLRCRRCGAKLAPAGLIAAVRSRLPGEGFASMGETLCPDCRILGQTKPRSPASPPLRRDS
ncbi:MAG: 4Fe-4S binding protein, partial [Chloroflexota bacterium]|nr:4Fe-4S binding protein [Chloroflexota bacterium]